MSETGIQNNIRLAVSATQRAIWLRNNTGLFLTLDGKRKVRAGLGKSTSDLIGWVSHTVRPEDVGKKIAVFVAAEVKDEGRTSEGQEGFLGVVANAGGIAGVVRSTEDAISLVDQLWDSPSAVKPEH
jgi:hypothetical protein